MYARHWSSLAAVTLSVLAGSLWAAESGGQAAQITFGGKILDRQGRPVSDAKVVLYEVNHGGSGALPGAERVKEVITGPRRQKTSHSQARSFAFGSG